MSSDDIKSALNTLQCGDLIQTIFASGGTGLGHKNAAGTQVVDLVELDKHGVIEHDSSLCRSDYNIGDNVHLNTTLLNQLKSFSTDGVYLTLKELAAFRKAREADSLARNVDANGKSTYTFGLKEQFIAYGESSLLFLAMRVNDTDDAPMRLDWIEYLFINERFPFELGWTLRPITLAATLSYAAELKTMNSLPTWFPSDWLFV
ncbi:hypothetical protein HDU76_000361 [Blyttiomyces sp. JEL0837]|nr:hypothetical protein HDU76_000361 [Blyttiomyces sp. JEL0837]